MILKANQSDVIDCTGTCFTQKDPGSCIKDMVDSTTKKEKKNAPQNRNATWKIHNLIPSCVFGITRHTNLKMQRNNLSLFPSYRSRAVVFIPAAAERAGG